jgi:hypothetical protein
MEKIWFFLGLSFILLHEMDAIRCHEWRIFPGLSLLSDRWGKILFIYLHLPLFLWMFFEISELDTGFRNGFNWFLIIHLILHLLFLMHRKNEFKDWISWSLIAGAALFAGIDLYFMN